MGPRRKWCPFDKAVANQSDDGESRGEMQRAQQEAERIAEALVFASSEPVSEKAIAEKLPEGTDVHEVMKRLAAFYSTRGVNLLRVDDHWAFRTAADLSFLIQRDQTDLRKLSRAALGSVGDHCLSPAGHTGGNRGNTRCRHLPWHARCVAGDRMDQDAGPPAHARSPGHLRLNARVSGSFWSGRTARPARAWTN